MLQAKTVFFDKVSQNIVFNRERYIGFERFENREFRCVHGKQCEFCHVGLDVDDIFIRGNGDADIISRQLADHFLEITSGGGQFSRFFNFCFNAGNEANFIIGGLEL